MTTTILISRKETNKDYQLLLLSATIKDNLQRKLRTTQLAKSREK